MGPSLQPLQPQDRRESHREEVPSLGRWGAARTPEGGSAHGPWAWRPCRQSPSALATGWGLFKAGRLGKNLEDLKF